MKRHVPQGKLDWLSVDTDNCSVAGALHVLGDKWTLLIVRDAFNGTKRFADFCAQTGAPRALVASRLKDLVAAGILRQEAYREPRARVRHHYVLTSKGRDLQHILIALREWGDAHVNPPDDHPLELVEHNTGTPVHLGLVRETDQALVDPRSVRLRPGSGIVWKDRGS
jgi:DNA-binding HxlR family transcriptional regulator